MMSRSLSHQQYQDFVRHFCSSTFISTGQLASLQQRKDWLAKLWPLDLSRLTDILHDYYAPDGRPSKDPTALFRSLLLMNITGETSITEWVDTLKANPLCAILSGFRPWDRPDLPNPEGQEGLHGEVPGVGTFYEFIDRFTQADFLIRQRKREKQQRKPRKFRKRPTKKPGASKGDKAPEPRENRHPGSVSRLVCGEYLRLAEPLFLHGSFVAALVELPGTLPRCRSLQTERSASWGPD